MKIFESIIKYKKSLCSVFIFLCCSIQSVNAAEIESATESSSISIVHFKPASSAGIKHQVLMLKQDSLGSDKFTNAPKSVKVKKSNPIDPYENFNRNSFRMNQTLDRNFVRPTTVWYITYIPLPVRAGVQNFFNNLRDFVTLGNDVLQLNSYRGVKDTARICINSTVGILGLIDVSSHLGLPEHINTFGHTMQFYGWEHSSYYMIPFLGPSTVRDAIGMIPDLIFNPTWWFNYPYSNYVATGLFAVNNIDQRSKFLSFDQTLQTSIDPYATVRDFYLQSSGNLPAVESSNEIKIDSLLDD
jgi:phospholipid-binding lipoprotein MlaA